MSTTVAAPAQQPVTALTASQNVLDSFWNLAAEEEDKRLSAAEALVEELLAGQGEHVKGMAADAAAAAAPSQDGEEVPKHMRQEVALRKCSPLMVYTLRRLVRGLGSGRNGARQGFATALALLLSKQVRHQPAPAEQQQQQQQQQQPWFLGAADALVLLDTCLESSSSMKASDAREILVGKLFGLGALVQSGLLTDAGAAPAAGGKAAVAAAPPIDVQPCALCVKQLLALGSSRSFLREASAAAVLELMWALGPDGAGLLLLQSEELQATVTVAAKDATPEALLLALCLWPVMSPELRAAAPLPPNCPAPPASTFFPPRGQQQPGSSGVPPAAFCDGLFSTTYLQSILPALKGTISSNPKLHSLWAVLLPLLLPGMAAGAGASTPAGLRHVSAFWDVVVERGLLTTPSHERKFLAFKLFQTMLKHLGPEHVSVVFSTNFTKTLLGNLRSKDNYLHAAAKRCMDLVTAFADGAGGEGGGSTRLAVMAVLQKLGVKVGGAAGKAGKAAEPSVAPLEPAAVSEYLARMRALFVAGGGERGAPDEAAAAKRAAAGDEAEAERRAEAESQRAYAVEQLCTVTRFPTASGEEVLRVLRFLATHAFMEVSAPAGAAGGDGGKKAAGKKRQKPKAGEEEEEVAAAAAAAAAGLPVSATTRRLCAQRLVTLLGVLAPNKQAAQTKRGADADADAAEEQPQARDGPKIMGQLLGYVRGLLTSSAAGGATLAAPLGPEQDVAMALLSEVEAALAAGGAAAAAAGERGGACRSLLHLVRLLQVHLLADPGCVDPELAVGLRRVAREGLDVALPDLEVQGEQEEQEEAAPWADVLVDVALSLLSRPASVLPTASLRDAIDATWRGMSWSLTPQGMQDLVRVVVAGGDRGADGGGDVLDEEEDEEEEEEVEEEGGVGKGADSDGDGDGESDGGDGSDDDDDDDGGGDDDDDDGPDEDDAADDAEMFRMDAKMAAYLRGMVDARKDAKEHKQALANLRLRALALIESFAKKVPNSPLLPPVLLPLTRALRVARRTSVGPEQSDISRRLQAVVEAICASGRPAALELGMGVEELEATLRRSLWLAGHDRDRVAGQLAGRVWCRLVKVAAAATAPEGAAAAAAAAFRAGLAAVLNKRSRLHRAVLEEAAMAAVAAAVPAMPDLVRGCGSARNIHSQVLALQMLARLIRPPTKQQLLQQQQQQGGQPPQPEPGADGGNSGDTWYFGSSGGGDEPSSLHAALAYAVTQQRQPLAAGLAAAASGLGLKKLMHVEALKAAVSILESTKRLFNRRLAEVLGPESILGLAKAVATVKAIGVPPKVSTQLDRLVAASSLSELLAKTEPDPALKTKLLKAQAKLELELQQKHEAAAEMQAAKRAERLSGGHATKGGQQAKAKEVKKARRKEVKAARAKEDNKGKVSNHEHKKQKESAEAVEGQGQQQRQKQKRRKGQQEKQDLAVPSNEGAATEGQAVQRTQEQKKRQKPAAAAATAASEPERQGKKENKRQKVGAEPEQQRGTDKATTGPRKAEVHAVPSAALGKRPVGKGGPAAKQAKKAKQAAS